MAMADGGMAGRGSNDEVEGTNAGSKCDPPADDTTTADELGSSWARGVDEALQGRPLGL